MEKKTIGGFIAALRKANGMTQKDLAERLHVSDKTVSRWEREEGTPDLSLIPVIAELFGVTCDELLRGERKSPKERATEVEEPDSTPKGEKEKLRLLKLTFSQYQTLTSIAIGVSVVGLLIALVCNLAFLRAVLGFLFGAVFFAASMICQAIFTNHTMLRVEDAQLEASELSNFRRRVIRLAELSFGITVGLLGFTVPMAFLDAYAGLSLESMFRLGAIDAAGALLLYAVVCYFLNASFLRRGIYSLSEKEAARYYHNHKLKRNIAICLIILLAFTFLIHQPATTLWGPGSVMKGRVFTDYESFIAFMEQDVSPPDSWAAGQAAPVPDKEHIYYDASGNPITEEEALHRTLEDKNGNVVCEYTDRNQSVVSIRYTPREGTVLPITVCTYDDLEKAKETVQSRTGIFLALYWVEVIAALAVYFIKRSK